MTQPSVWRWGTEVVFLGGSAFFSFSFKTECFFDLFVRATFLSFYFLLSCFSHFFREREIEKQKKGEGSIKRSLKFESA